MAYTSKVLDDRWQSKPQERSSPLVQESLELKNSGVQLVDLVLQY